MSAARNGKQVLPWFLVGQVCHGFVFDQRFFLLQTHRVTAHAVHPLVGVGHGPIPRLPVLWWFDQA